MAVPPAPPTEPIPIACDADEGFAAWLAKAGGTIAITTYQAGKLVLVGHDGQKINVLMRQFEKPMGLAVDGLRMAIATRHDVVMLANAPLLAPDYIEAQKGRYNGLYLPRATYHTGDLAAHDLAFAKDGLWIVNTRFSCLAALSTDFSFVPRWTPPFITQHVPEDRCHLNGLAVRDGEPTHVTMLGATDSAGGWRPTKATGGLIMDVKTNAVVTSGLCMPHSPRWNNGTLFVLNSGAGELQRVDVASGATTTICRLNGFLRGLSFVGPFALIGLCRIREQHIFGGLPIAADYQNLICGVAIVDLRNGKLQGMLKFTSGCQELYDVQFLPGVSRPNVLNTLKPVHRFAFTAPEFAYWMRPEAPPGTPQPKEMKE